ncbi:DMT family transporter [Yokenella regensburgei]|uniref:DMT family transporter n=1 Tax=Yokenella regensburgei TaxID=158877 RepID=UPI00137563C8|nr:DMT family transporter [Yokenella regensburgei]KAF1369883.1 drug/metabolite transporter (DMT)-like permease [Yokenella regensburgei]
MNQKTFIAFAFLGLIWGTNFLFMHQASRWISPLQIVFLRVLFGFLPILALACWHRVFRRQHLRHAHHFVVMALLATVIYYWAFASGTSLLLSGISGVLSGAIPLFSFIMAALFLRQEPMQKLQVVGIVLGFAGVLMIARPWAVSADSISLAGVGYMVLGSLSVGASFVYARRFLAPLQLPALALTSYQIGAALLILALVTPFSGLSAILHSPSASLGLVLGLGLLGTGVAYLIYYFLIQRLGAVTASSITYIPPVVALVIGVVFAGEAVTAAELLSLVLISAGVFLLQRRDL